MSMMSIMKTGLLSLLAVAMAVSPAISAKHHRLHFRHAHAATLNLTKVNLHPVSDLDRPEPTPRIRVRSDSDGEQFPPGARAAGPVGRVSHLAGGERDPEGRRESAAATQYGSGDKTVGAAVGIRF